MTGRQNVVAFSRGFHGLSLGALAATGNAGTRMGVQNPLFGVTRMPYAEYFGEGVDTADQLAATLTDTLSGVDAPAAIPFEAVQGEGELNTASVPWLRRVAAVAREHGALLIVDDVQAGVGRTGARPHELGGLTLRRSTPCPLPRVARPARGAEMTQSMVDDATKTQLDPGGADRRPATHAVPAPTEVWKFGGTSVGDENRIQAVAALYFRCRRGHLGPSRRGGGRGGRGGRGSPVPRPGGGDRRDVVERLRERGSGLGAMVVDGPHVLLVAPGRSESGIAAALHLPLGAGGVSVHAHTGSVSVVSTGMARNPEIPARALAVLGELDVTVHLVTTAPGRVVLHVPTDRVADATRALHDDLVERTSDDLPVAELVEAPVRVLAGDAVGVA